MSHRTERLLFHWLRGLWGLASLESTGLDNKLEIQVRVNVAVLGPNLQCRPTGGKLKQGFYLAV